MTERRLEITCPHCGRLHAMRVDKKRLARLSRVAVCGGCGQRFNLLDQVLGRRATQLGTTTVAAALTQSAVAERKVSEIPPQVRSFPPHPARPDIPRVVDEPSPIRERRPGIQLEERPGTTRYEPPRASRAAPRDARRESDAPAAKRREEARPPRRSQRPVAPSDDRRESPTPPRRSQRPVAISDDRRESPTPPRATRSSSPASWHRSEPPPAEPPRAISPRRVFDGGPFARSSSAPPRVSSVPPHSSPVPPHSSSVPPHSSPLPPHSSPVPPHGSSPPPYSSGHGGLFSAGPPAGDSSLPPRISSTPSSLPPVDDLPRRRRDTDPSLAPPPFDELDEEADRVTVHPILEVQRDPDEPLLDDEDLWDEDTADRPTLLLPEEPTAFVAVAEVQGASSTLEAETPHVLMSRDAWMALATPSLADLPAPKTPLSQALEALLI